MKTNYLLPNRFKKLGWILFILGLILGVLIVATDYEPDFLSVRTFAFADSFIFSESTYFSFTTSENNLLDEITGVLIILGAIFIAFSKQKNEDEFISQIRLESLVWATYINYFVLIVGILFVFGMSFFWVLIFNMFTILFFFIIRFNWVLSKSAKMIVE